MSRATDAIDRVLATDLLMPEMLVLPAPADNARIAKEESELPRPLSEEHRSLLKRWDGANLDVLRIFGCEGTNEDEIGSLARRQVGEVAGVRLAIAFGSDPSGFVFLESDDGSVWSVDSDGVAVRRLSSTIGEFFELLVFGPNASDFGGDEWLAELRDAGLVP